jgi:hypothetical protein
MRFDFEKDSAFSFENEKALQEDLNKLLDQNKVCQLLILKTAVHVGLALLVR